MTRAGNPAFVRWNRNIVDFMGDDTEGNIDNSMHRVDIYRDLDWSKVRPGNPGEERSNYFSLSNLMWYAMATKDEALQNEIQSKWVTFSSFRQCYSFMTQAGLTDPTGLYFETSEDRWNDFKNQGNGIGFYKFNGVQWSLMRPFQQIYGTDQISEVERLNPFSWLYRILKYALA